MNNPPKQVRRTEKQIRVLLYLQERKNIAVIAFCKAHKIHKATFYNWRNKYGLQIEKPQQFIPVHFADPVSEAALFAEIELASKVTVRLFQRVEASYFKALL